MQAIRDFDSVAAKWDKEPRRVKLANDVASAIIREAKPKKSEKVLDYGCGTGLVTLALLPYVAEVVAADSSKGMLAQLEQKLQEAGITEVKTCFVSLESPCSLEPGFDLVVSSMTMHHVVDVSAQVLNFKGLLRQGGRLCIADLDKEDGTFHDDPTGIAHHGFSNIEMELFFRSAGFSNIRTVRVATIQKPVDSGLREYHVNLTLGTA